MKNLKEQKFGHLTPKYKFRKFSSGKMRSFWVCDCMSGLWWCDESTEVREDRLISGLTKSCGCLAKGTQFKTKHGMSNTRTWDIWFGLHDRCRNIKNDSYKFYGARGIKVCRRWSGENGFSNFFNDMGMIPKEYDVHRIDKNGSYGPWNCIIKERRQHLLDHFAKLGVEDVKTIKCLLRDGAKGVDLANKFGVCPSTISAIKNNINWKGVE